ncbi:MAG: hypothetical protein N3E49_07630 [Bacteroidia bacterium]|nr:hypothetical protein [Bacteroidia bacterium]
MLRAVWLLLGVLSAQKWLTMGARFQFSRSQLLSSTDHASSLTTSSPTHKAGVVGFFGWGWLPYLATSLELSYQGVGQKYYGIGVRGESYAAEIDLHYLRMALAFQPQYAHGTWGLWASISPGLSFLAQSELAYQGDSLPQGSIVAPQIIRRVLTHLDQSTDPDDRLLLVQMYRRSVPSLNVSGGLRIRLAPSVWVLGLLHYERSFGDIEKKGARLTNTEVSIYDPQRKPVQYQLWGVHLGLQYEVNLHP